MKQQQQDSIMDTKSERLLFTRKRLIRSIEMHITTIAMFTKHTAPAIQIVRKEALEACWAELIKNSRAIEATQDWFGTDEYLDEHEATHEKYIAALVMLHNTMPKQTETLHRALNTVRGTQRTRSCIKKTIVRPIKRSNVLDSPQNRASIRLSATEKLSPPPIKLFGGRLVNAPEFTSTYESPLTNTLPSIPKYDAPKKTNIFGNFQKCNICRTNTHFTYACTKLVAIEPTEREQFIREKGLCINCLHFHSDGKCTSRVSCKLCGQRHNSMLHVIKGIHSLPTVNNINVLNAYHSNSQTVQVIEMPGDFSTHDQNHSRNTVVSDPVKMQNNIDFAESAIEQISMRNLITNLLCKTLWVPTAQINMRIISAHESVTYMLRHKATLTLVSKVDSQFSKQINVLPDPNIVALTHHSSFQSWPCLQNTKVNPLMNTKNRVNILEIIRENGLDVGVLESKPDQSIARETQLGWIFTGGGIRIMLTSGTLRTFDDCLTNGLVFCESKEQTEIKICRLKIVNFGVASVLDLAIQPLFKIEDDSEFTKDVVRQKGHVELQQSVDPEHNRLNVSSEDNELNERCKSIDDTNRKLIQQSMKQKRRLISIEATLNTLNAKISYAESELIALQGLFDAIQGDRKEHMRCLQQNLDQLQIQIDQERKQAVKTCEQSSSETLQWDFDTPPKSLSALHHLPISDNVIVSSAFNSNSKFSAHSTDVQNYSRNVITTAVARSKLNNRFIIAKNFMEQGSTNNFNTERFNETSRLPVERMNTPIISAIVAHKLRFRITFALVLKADATKINLLVAPNFKHHSLLQLWSNLDIVFVNEQMGKFNCVYVSLGIVGRNMDLVNEVLENKFCQSVARETLLRWTFTGGGNRLNFGPLTFTAQTYDDQLVDEIHMEGQRILWHSPVSIETKSYRFKTVTFEAAREQVLTMRSLLKIIENIYAWRPEFERKMKIRFCVDNYPDLLETRKEARKVMSSTLSEFEATLTRSIELLLSYYRIDIIGMPPIATIIDELCKFISSKNHSLSIAHAIKRFAMVNMSLQQYHQKPGFLEVSLPIQSNIFVRFLRMKTNANAHVGYLRISLFIRFRFGYFLGIDTEFSYHRANRQQQNQLNKLVQKSSQGIETIELVEQFKAEAGIQKFDQANDKPRPSDFQAFVIATLTTNKQNFSNQIQNRMIIWLCLGLLPLNTSAAIDSKLFSNVSYRFYVKAILVSRDTELVSSNSSSMATSFLNVSNESSKSSSKESRFKKSDSLELSNNHYHSL